MKLTLGENIRKFRRMKDMTQEQLADRLGISYQAVSRWENGATYPDIELIPTLAEIFETTTDELLGVPNAEKEKQANALIDAFCSESYKENPDKEKMASLIREIRRDFIGIGAHYKLNWFSNQSVVSSPEVLGEFRQYAEENLEAWPMNADLVRFMVEIEDDEHLDAFLEKHTTSYDMNRDNLLRRRYYSKQEFDKYDLIRQLDLFGRIDSLLLVGWKDLRTAPDLRESFYLNTFLLNTLHGFEQKTPTPEHPISCDGEIDCWVESKITLGTRRACYLAALGETENAFAVLEDIVSLLEKVMKITEKTELRRSHYTPDIVWTAEADYHQPNNNPNEALERMILISEPSGNTVLVYPSVTLERLTAPSGWGWFDPIRNDPRYQQYVDRVKALVVTMPPRND